MSYINLTNPVNYQLQDFGQMGFRVIGTSAPSVATEEFRTIYVLQDAVVSANTAKGDNIVSKSILAGTRIHGLFTNISLASGKVLAYLADKP
jgi:hypothetical protein